MFNVAGFFASICRCLQSILAVSVCLSSSTPTAPTTGMFPRILDNDTICNENKGVVIFECQGASLWMIDGRLLPAKSPDGNYSITQIFHRNILRIQCLAKYNNSAISCYSITTNQTSNSVLLQVQGVLGPVIGLKFELTSQTLTWEKPHQLNTSENISYIVVINKISEDSEGEAAAAIEEHVYFETHLLLRGRLMKGATYNASVRAVNVVGEGQEDSVRFEVEAEKGTAGDHITADNDATGESQTSSNASANESRLKAIVGGVGGGVLCALIIILLVVGIVLCIYKRGSNSSSCNAFPSPSKPVQSTNEDDSSPMRNAVVSIDGFRRRHIS